MVDNTEQIKARINIVDLIQEYIKLTPAGVNNYKAKCPFHNEKTPSFMVSKDKQIWHCFGCSEGGDIFTWVQKIEGVDFPEALRILAKKANVELDFQQPQQSNQKTKLMDVCTAATKHWHSLLQDDKQAAQVRKYLRLRGINQETVLEWELGWAKESWDDTLSYLQQQGFDPQQIFDAGLAVKKEKGGGYYDRFRNRLIFPIKNHNAQTVGFTGRTMGDDKAKYINTPQTQIYDKSKILYGLHKAKTYIHKMDYTILVEGNMDVISAWQAGTKNVAAVSGTALTLEQINLLKRYSNNIKIAFDADSAGQKAALRGLDLAWQEGMNVKIIKLKAGDDPDECIQEDKKLWLESVKEAVNIIDYYFEIVLQDLDMSRSDHKKKAASELLPIIAKLPDEIERTHYLQKLSDIIAVSFEILENKITQFKDKQSSKQDSSQPVQEHDLSHQDPVRLSAERILAILLIYPQKIDVAIQELMPEAFQQDDMRRLYKKLVVHYNNNSFDDLSLAEIRKEIDNLIADEKDLQMQVGKLQLLADKEFSSLTDKEIQRELEQLIARLKVESKKAENVKLREELKRAEAMNDQDKVDQLSQQIEKNIKQIHSVS